VQSRPVRRVFFMVLPYPVDVLIVEKGAHLKMNCCALKCIGSKIVPYKFKRFKRATN